MRFPKARPSQPTVRKELRARIANAFRILRRMGLTATMTDRQAKSYKNQDLSTRVSDHDAYVDFPMEAKDADSPELHKVPTPFLHGVIKATLEGAGLHVKWDGQAHSAMLVALPAEQKKNAA